MNADNDIKVKTSYYHSLEQGRKSVAAAPSNSSGVSLSAANANNALDTSGNSLNR